MEPAQAVPCSTCTSEEWLVPEAAAFLSSRGLNSSMGTREILLLETLLDPFCYQDINQEGAHSRL